MSTARSHMPPCTVEDYKLMPETGPRYQLVEGDLLMAPAPNRYHQDISRNLEYLLLRFLEENPIGILYHAPFDVYLDDINVLQPDIAVILTANRGILTDAGAEGAPDFIVEILSPKTRRIDLDPKKKVYGRCGVKELWMIDPEPQRVEVFELPRSTDQPAHVWGIDSTLTSPLFPGLAISAARVFAR